MDIRMCFVASSHDLLAHRVTTSRRRPLGAEMGRVMVLLTILATTTALRPGAPVLNRRAALTGAGGALFSWNAAVAPVSAEG